MLSRVTVVVRYAFGSAMTVPGLARPGQADERILRDVLGVADRPGHPVGDGEQQRPVGRHLRVICLPSH